jgi:hypothetical protein
MINKIMIEGAFVLSLPSYGLLTQLVVGGQLRPCSHRLQPCAGTSG